MDAIIVAQAKSKILRLLIAFTAIFAAQVSRADVSYEAALALPWRFVEDSINPTSGREAAEYHFNLGEINFTAQGVPVKIPQSELNLSLHLKPVLVQKNKTIWETDLLSLQVNVGPFQVSKDITREINGVIVIVHLEASCQPFVLSQSGAHTVMNWEWQASGNQINAVLGKIDLDWPVNSWIVSGLNCSGPEGFGDLVKADLEKELAQADPLIPLTRSSLEKLLNYRANLFLDQWRAPQPIPGSKEISLQLNQTAILNDQGFLFSGTLKLKTEGPDQEIVKLNLPKDLLQKASDQPTFVFSNKSLQSLIQVQDIWPTFDTELANVSGVKPLLYSRILQATLWPDLIHYSRWANFEVHSQLEKPAELIFGERNLIQAKIPVITNVKSHRNGRDWNYVQLKTLISSEINFSVNKGKMNLHLNDPSLDTRSSFGSSYQQHFSPNTRIATETLDRIALCNSNFRDIDFKLPTLKFSDDFTFRAKQVNRADANFFFMTFERVAL